MPVDKTLAARLPDEAKWLLRVSGAIFTNAPLQTSVAIVAQMVSTIFHMLGLLIPLKILLVAGSPEVPPYMVSISGSITRQEWIILLTVCSVSMVCIGLFSSALVGNLVGSGGRRLVGTRCAEQNLSQHKKRASMRAYKTICQMLSDFAVALLILGILAVADTLLFLAVIAILPIEVLLTSWLCQPRGGWIGRDLRSRIVRNHIMHLRYLVAMNFFLGFFIIVGRFWEAPFPNIILAVLTLFVLRLLMQALDGLCKRGIALTKSKRTIELYLVESAN